MRIAAIQFTKENDMNTTLNLGGRFIYKFFNSNKRIERVENPRYIDGFYSYRNDTVDNVTAIVGKNGSGKTSLIEDIILLIKGRDWNFIEFTCIYEKYINGHVVETLIQSNLKNVEVAFEYSKFEKEEFLDDEPESLNRQVILYTPFIDFRNPIEEIINLKNDYILKQDYELDNLKNEDSKIVDPLFMHKRANDKRFMEFNNTEFAKVVFEAFHIPIENNFTIKFNQFHKPATSNIPSNFEDFVISLYSRLDMDLQLIRENKEDQTKMQKKLFKTYILESLINQIVHKMNEEHDYLEEGVVLPNWSSLVFDNAQQQLYWFLNNHRIKLGGALDPKRGKYTSIEQLEPFQALSAASIIEFLNFIYLKIDSLGIKDEEDNPYFDWDNRSIIITKNEVLNFFELEDKYLFGLSNYFSRVLGSKSDNSFLNLKYLISFEYSRYKLSTGEISLLNIFSRFYSYFNYNYFKSNRVNKFSYFYIFLDEADLGFHPEWKVKFIEIMIKFIESFFTDKRINSKVQIIFTTHDPLTLSDILNYNVHYIPLDKNLEEIQKKSFGANIYDLLNNSFFLKSPIGAFAEKKIDEVINWLSHKKEGSKVKLNHQEKGQEYYQKVIELIDEPLIKSQLQKMYIEVTRDTSSIEKEIERLQKLLPRK